eukprot:280348_1
MPNFNKLLNAINKQTQQLTEHVKLNENALQIQNENSLISEYNITFPTSSSDVLLHVLQCAEYVTSNELSVSHARITQEIISNIPSFYAPHYQSALRTARDIKLKKHPKSKTLETNPFSPETSRTKLLIAKKLQTVQFYSKWILSLFPPSFNLATIHDLFSNIRTRRNEDPLITLHLVQSHFHQVDNIIALLNTNRGEDEQYPTLSNEFKTTTLSRIFISNNYSIDRQNEGKLNRKFKINLQNQIDSMHITATDYNKFSTQIQKQRDTTLPASTIDYDHDNSHWIPYVISNQMKFIFTYDHDKDNNTIIESFTRKYGRHHEHATATNESSDAASCDQEPPLKRRRTCKGNDQDDNDNKRRTPSKLNIKCTNGSDCLDF